LLAGWPALWTIFLAGILGGSLLSVFLHRNEHYRALGASGGVCGVVFAPVFLLPGGSLMLFLTPIPIPAHLDALAFPLVSFVAFRRQADHMGHDAHLGRTIIGLLEKVLRGGIHSLSGSERKRIEQLSCGVGGR